MNERHIKLPEKTITSDVLAGLMLDQSLPIEDQRDKYREGIHLLRSWLNLFRNKDGSLALYQEYPAELRIPVIELVRRDLIPSHAVSRIEGTLDTDEVWMTYEKTQVRDEQVVDSMKMSYIARYKSYQQMRDELKELVVPEQRARLDKVIPPANYEVHDNHATIEEVLELTDFELKEVRKSFVEFHFHMADTQEGGFIARPRESSAETLELKVNKVMTARAYNRFLNTNFLPHVENIFRLRS